MLQLPDRLISHVVRDHLAPPLLLFCFLANESSSAASAIAANTFLRSISAAGFPLFARQMFNGMGIEWAGTLLGCFAFCLVPIPVLFYFYGKKLRQKSKFAPTMAIKKPADEEGSSDEDEELQMAALHATRSKVHQDLETGRRRSRSGTNGSAAPATATSSAVPVSHVSEKNN